MRKIWLADDDADDREFFQQALCNISENISLVTADNGELLLSALLSDTTAVPDMIFLDMNMPKLNGVETLIKLRENIRFARFPVVAFTTSGSSDLIEQMYKHGADFYVIKPMSFQALEKIIYKVLLYPFTGRKKPTRENFVLSGLSAA